MPSPTRQVSRRAMSPELRDVPRHRLPASDLSLVVRPAPSSIVPAIPLKPPPRVVRVYPPLRSPIPQGFGRAYQEIIQFWPGRLVTKLRPDEPVFGKFRHAVGHVSSAENPEGKHLFRRQVGVEPLGKTRTLFLGEFIAITPLHQVVYDDDLAFHLHTPSINSYARVVRRQYAVTDSLPTPPFSGILIPSIYARTLLSLLSPAH